MNQKIIAAAMAVVFGMALVKYYRDRRKKRDAEAKAGKPADGCAAAPEEGVEMERAFLDEVASGRRAVRIASAYDQYDIMFIKSLFQSEQIPYYFEFENKSKLRTGIPALSFNDAILNVLEDDYDDARAVLEAYKEGPRVEGTGDDGEGRSDGSDKPPAGGRAIELYDRPTPPQGSRN